MAEVGRLENAVLIGIDGYLFLGGEDGARAAFAAGLRPIAEPYFDVFAQNIAARSAWAAARGCAYTHLIVPDKPSILPDAWPLQPPLPIGQLYLDRHPELAAALAYPLALLRGQDRAVSRLDTHLSLFGSALLASHLAERFEAAAQQARFAQIAALIDRPLTVQGDLGSRLQPARSETVYTLRIEPPGVSITNQTQGGQDGGIDLRRNPDAPYAKRVVMFGDALGRNIARCLQFFYREVIFLRSAAFHPEIAERLAPDILITEQTERYLDHAKADAKVLEFLQLPYFAEPGYAPSAAFVQAFAEMAAPAAPPRQAAALTAFSHVQLTDLPAQAGLLQTLEAPVELDRPMPALVADFSDVGMQLALRPQQRIHGSVLVQRSGVLLFGPNHLVDPAGGWSCEARSFKQQYLDYYQQPFYGHGFPGPKPRLLRDGASCRLDVSALRDEDVLQIDAPVFLATPLEPPIWGRWIATVVHKAKQFQDFAGPRKFFCHQALPWQRAFLALLGVPEAQILPHDPGRTYLCRDVMTVELSEANMTVSALERTNYYALAARHRRSFAAPRKLFVSRLSRSRHNPNYRVLQNETALAEMLETLGFHAIEPERLSIEQQIAWFAGAEQVVFLGGSGVFNAAFCAPGTPVVTIESSNEYAVQHTDFFASLGLRYGVVFGRQDPEDPAPSHRRWTIDVPRTREALAEFFAA